MVRARRFGQATYITPDVAKQVEYYTGVIGLTAVINTPERAVLASRTGEEAIVIERGPESRCSGISFQVDSEFDFSEVKKALDLPGEYRSDTTPGIARSFVMEDPLGIKVELFQTPKPGQASSPAGAAPLRAAHISFSVPDCKKAMEFYVEKFGFRVSDWMGDFFVFLRCSPDHHSINFHSHQDITKAAVHHFAFEFKDWAHIQAACEALGKNKRQIIWGPGRHGIGHGIFVYHRDPDDNIVEFFTEIDQLKDEELGYFEPRPWHEDYPQRPKQWTPEKAALIWGTPPSPDFLRGSKRQAPAEPTLTGRDKFLAR
jgi:catechol 2,3-dioxygenase-like lactoylglutathione lyase family enzyme